MEGGVKMPFSGSQIAVVRGAGRMILVMDDRAPFHQRDKLSHRGSNCFVGCRLQVFHLPGPHREGWTLCGLTPLSCSTPPEGDGTGRPRRAQ
jgi:hypothetical protein